MIIKFIKHLLANYIYKKEVENHINSSPYKNNLYSVNWLKENHNELMEALPSVWTHIDNIDFLVFGFKLKLLDVPWSNKTDLVQILQYLESIDLLIRKNGYQIVRNSDSQFKPDSPQ